MPMWEANHDGKSPRFFNVFRFEYGPTRHSTEVETLSYFSVPPDVQQSQAALEVGATFQMAP